MKSLQQAKEAFPNVYLIVGVCSDKETHKRKGLTVLKDTERYESVKNCKWVDEVIEDAPWIITNEFLEHHQIDYVAHDDIPYASEGQADVYEFVKKAGKFLVTKRTEGISTSDLIIRILKNYNGFIQRNLARGYTPNDLNITQKQAEEILKIKL